MNIIDDIMVMLPIALVAIALSLALALRCSAGVTRWRRTGACRAGASRAAGDPFFYPFGEMPTLPPEQDLDRLTRSAGALRRNENGGRSASLSGTAVVLTFPGRKA